MKMYCSIVLLLSAFVFYGQKTVNQQTRFNGTYDTVVNLNTESKAIGYAEPILFKAYGKRQIESEKPYKVYQYKNIWVMTGTLPKGWLGGTFYISFYARDGKIITLTHGK